MRPAAHASALVLGSVAALATTQGAPSRAMPETTTTATRAAPQAPSKSEAARTARLLTDLGNETDAVARNRAYLEFVRDRPIAALAPLAERLPGFGLASQELGLAVVQVYPEEDALPVLRKLMLGKAPLLEVGAAVVFVRLGQRDVLEHLVGPFERAGLAPSLRRALLRRVYLVREPRLSAAVRGWVVADGDPDVLEDALEFLLRSEDEATAPRVAALLSRADAPSRVRAACAAYALARGEVSRGAILAEIARAEGPMVFARLQRFLTAADDLGPELLAAVTRAAESASAIEASALIAILAVHAGANEFALLERWAARPEVSLARAALDALRQRSGTVPRAALTRLLSAREPERALMAADLLRRADDLAGFDRVVEIARAAGPARAEALRVLARFPERAAVPPLLDALQDADPAVRTSAEQGLTSLLRQLFPYRRFDLATTGYAATAPAEARAAGISKLRAWWAAHAKD